MIRKGPLGEIVHCYAAHSHHCIDHWFWEDKGNERWGAQFLIQRHCDRYRFARKLGPDHPNAKRKFAQGDIVTSIIRTHNGKSAVVKYDMQLPRPYDNRWMINRQKQRTHSLISRAGNGSRAARTLPPRAEAYNRLGKTGRIPMLPSRDRKGALPPS
jgi:hypothetical protein